MGARTLLLLLALLASAATHAAQLLREVIQHGSAAEAGPEAPELEILLGMQVTLIEGFAGTDGHTFTAEVKPTAADGSEWQFAELRFDEAGYDISHVTMEGSTDRSFRLTVHFKAPFGVATLPQYATDRIALKYVDLRNYRRAQAEAARDTDADGQWAIELAPAQSVLTLEQMPRALLLNRSLYAVAREDAGAALRLGFFSAGKARSVLRQVQGPFPGARPVAVTEAEAAYGAHMRLNSARVTALYSPTPRDDEPAAAPAISIATATAGTLADPEPTPSAALVPWEEDVDDSLLTQAKDAYIAGEYAQAVALYTKAATVPAFRFEALEMLGVTREQTGQLAQAKRAYETVLAEYGAHPDAGRVRARLQSLVSIDIRPRELRKPSNLETVSWHTTALLSQFYRRYSVHIDRQGTSVPIDGLFSDVDLSARRSSGSASHEARISLGHLQDFSNDADSRNLRVQALYWESTVERLRTGVRLGRQSQRRSGVLGRFDGVAATVTATPRVDVQALGGYLLDSSYDSPQGDRPFWGVNADVRLLNDSLSVTPFFVQQNFDGVVDRQAVGIQGELYTDRGNYFGMLDYDLHHKALNHALLSANLRVGASTRVYGSIDHRRSPYLTTRNALIGQPVEDLTELELLLVESLIEERLEDIAADRSAVSSTLRFGIDRRFGSGWALSMDASVMDFGATDTSANVTGLDAHQDFYLSTQLRADNAFGQGNYGAVQVRYFQSDSTRTTGAYFNNRLGLGERWWLYPRLALDQREFEDAHQTQLRVKPSLRLDYRFSRRFRLELETGYEWTTREMVTGDLDMQGLFIIAGWRAML